MQNRRFAIQMKTAIFNTELCFIFALKPFQQRKTNYMSCWKIMSSLIINANSFGRFAFSCNNISVCSCTPFHSLDCFSRSESDLACTDIICTLATRRLLQKVGKNVLGYYRNLGSLRYGTSTASCKDAYGKMPFFSWTEVLFNHAVKLHDYWFVQV